MPELLLIQHLLVAAAISGLLYTAFAITIVGLAMMLGGPAAAQATAQVLIAAPLQWALGRGLPALLRAVAAAAAALMRALVRYLIDPLLRPIAYLIRVLLAGPPA